MDNKNTLTEIVFILDKSGSMESILDDTIGGFNSFLREQKLVDGDANMTLIQFSTNVTRTFTGKNLKDVEPLTKDTYRPSGWTALLDAMGVGITETVERIATKRKPTTDANAYFSDDNYIEHVAKAAREFNNLRAVLANGFYDRVVIPRSIGTGRADLYNKAPQVLEYIMSEIRKLYTSS